MSDDDKKVNLQALAIAAETWLILSVAAIVIVLIIKAFIANAFLGGLAMFFTGTFLTYVLMRNKL